MHEGKFTPGKFGEWRFDKRSYSQRPPPRHLGDPPPGMDNELVSILHQHQATQPQWSSVHKRIARTSHARTA